jgi:WD40 repeat protein
MREDALVKALLLALQMSLSCCTQHPTIPMLWAQMLNRTMALAATGQFGMAAWHDAQLSKWRQHAQRQKGSGVLHLLARTSSLQQSGGLYRATLRGHTAQVKTVVISPSGQQVVTASSDGTAQVGRWRGMGAGGCGLCALRVCWAVSGVCCMCAACQWCMIAFAQQVASASNAGTFVASTFMLSPFHSP